MNLTTNRVFLVSDACSSDQINLLLAIRLDAEGMRSSFRLGFGRRWKYRSTHQPSVLSQVESVYNLSSMKNHPAGNSSPWSCFASSVDMFMKKMKKNETSSPSYRLFMKITHYRLVIQCQVHGVVHVVLLPRFGKTD